MVTESVWIGKDFPARNQRKDRTGRFAAESDRPIDNAAESLAAAKYGIVKIGGKSTAESVNK